MAATPRDNFARLPCLKLMHGSKPCKEGCVCKRHTARSGPCPIGCRCSRHTPWPKMSHAARKKNGLAHKKALVSTICPCCKISFKHPRLRKRIFCSNRCSATGNIPWSKGLTKETDSRVADFAKKLKGRQFSAAHRALLGEAMVVRLTNGWPSPTNLEWALQLLLEDAGFDFETQKRFGRYAADMWVPSHSLVFEADGSFWHQQREQKYPGYHARRDKFLLSKGAIAVIHLTEHDLDPWLEA